MMRQHLMVQKKSNLLRGHIDCEADFELKAYHDDDDDENKGMFEGYASSVRKQKI